MMAAGLQLRLLQEMVPETRQVINNIHTHNYNMVNSIRLFVKPDQQYCLTWMYEDSSHMINILQIDIQP